MSLVVGFEKVEKQIKKDLRSSDVLLFAFNAVGKTRLSRTFEEEFNDKSLCYNAYIEDSYHWDNEEKILKYKNNWVFDKIEELGFDHDIVDAFKDCVGNKIEPYIDFSKETIEFKLATGDDQSKNNIKISRGEEALFKWSVYYVLVERALQGYGEEEAFLKDLRYVVIDDPITSLDDYRVCTVASQIVDLLKCAREKCVPIRFLINTHHLMLFNILYNSMKRDKLFKKSKFYKMYKIDNRVICEECTNRTLVYHLQQLKSIKESIEKNHITRGLFNILRSVLEKMCVILGFDHWSDLFRDIRELSDIEKEMLINSLNMNSHNQYADIDTEDVPEDQQKVFVKGFETLINQYKINLR